MERADDPAEPGTPSELEDLRGVRRKLFDGGGDDVEPMASATGGGITDFSTG
jgi:hypothetical protein